MDIEVLSLLLRMNLVLAAAVGFVLLARAPARAMLGARAAYALWLIPPLAAAMCFLPARTVTITLPAPAGGFPAEIFDPIPSPPVLAMSPAFDAPATLVALWAGGVLLCLAVLALRQRRFLRSLGRLTPRRDWGERVFGAETALAGPAVVGVVRPIIVAPADFGARYSAEEQRIVLAHERAHMAQGDPLINAIAAVIQCANWFNPMVHLGVRALRADQEFACDAAVLVGSPSSRRVYAEALIKAHGLAPAPMGCAWPPPDLNAVKERIVMLKRPSLSRAQALAAASIVALASVGVCALAWAAQPPRTLVELEVAEPVLASGEKWASAERGDDGELAGGPANHDYDHVYDYDYDYDHDLDFDVDFEFDPALVDSAEMRDEVREAIESMREAMHERREALVEARAAMAEARAEMEEQEREMAAHRAEMMLNEAEIAEIMREAMEEARRGMEEARRELEAAERAGAFEHESPAMAELQREAHALAFRAIELASADLDGGALDPAARAAAEAEMERQQTRIDELARQVEREAEARIETHRPTMHKSAHGDEDCEH